MAKSTVQTLIGTIGFVIVAIVALNIFSAKLDMFTVQKHTQAPAMPATLTLNLGSVSYVCALTSHNAYRCTVNLTRTQRR
jgi:hypothetical protein